MDQTSILIEVRSSELSIPDDIDQLQIRAETDAGPMADSVAALQGDWPHTLAVRPGGTPLDEPVFIHVTGFRSGSAVIRRVVETRFQSGRRVAVEVVLTADCFGMVCPGTRQDCVAGVCSGIVVIDNDGGTDAPDASTVDAGDPPPDAPGDACAAESCNEADDDCDDSIDEELLCPSSVVISELATGGPGGTGLGIGSDEFVELYNRTESLLDLSGLTIEYCPASCASFVVRATIPASASIPAHGFFLAGSENYARSPAPDFSSAWSTSEGLSGTGGHVRIVAPGGVEVDRVGWGGATMPEGAAVGAVADDHMESYERKALPSSDANSMQSGPDVALGNSYDSGDNAADFIHRAAAEPQNSSSATEAP